MANRVWSAFAALRTGFVMEDPRGAAASCPNMQALSLQEADKRVDAGKVTPGLVASARIAASESAATRGRDAVSRILEYRRKALIDRRIALRLPSAPELRRPSRHAYASSII